MLVGSGPSEVDRLLAWDSAEVASLLTEEGPLGSFRETLAGYDAALAYTRNATLVRSLGIPIPRVIAYDPVPPAGAGHASAWFARALEALDRPAEVEPATHSPTAEEETVAEPWLRRLGHGFLAIHPGSGSAAKNWPCEGFAALVDAVARGKRWLLVEGPADGRAAAPLRSRPGAVHARELPARGLGAVLARAGIFVGNDSGVSHLAAAWGTPTVALYGPTDPEVWRPIGERVRLALSPTGRMEDIGVADVLDAVEKIAGR